MYIAGKDITVGSEVTGSPVKELSSVYDATEEGLPVYEVSKSQNGYRVLKELSQKEIKKGIEKKYKRLDIAIFFKSLSEVKKIFELKTPVRRSSEYSLCYAVRSGSLPIVKAVMESGEIDLNDYYTKEALEVACELGYVDIVKYLLKVGLNPCDRQFYPLIWVRKSGNQELIDILEKDIKKRLGSLPEIKDPYEVMLENRAKVDIENKKVDIQAEKIDIEDKKVDIQKPKGRGSVKTNLPKEPKKKIEKPKKQIKSLEELKAASNKLLKDKEKKEVKPKVKEVKEKKKVLSLEELKARSKKLLDK